MENVVPLHRQSREIVSRTLTSEIEGEVRGYSANTPRPELAKVVRARWDLAHTQVHITNSLSLSEPPQSMGQTPKKKTANDDSL